MLFDGDYEVIHSREIRLTTARRLPIETPRSPQKGRTSWIVGESWEPEDSSELGLDPTGEWCDEAFEGPVTDNKSPAKKVRKRSSIPVSSVLVFEVLYLCLSRNKETSPSGLEGAVSKRVSR